MENFNEKILRNLLNNNNSNELIEKVDFNFNNINNNSLNNFNSIENYNNKIILNFNEKTNSLFGSKISTNNNNNNNSINLIWNYSLKKNKLINFKLAYVPTNIHITYNSSGKILYKYIDHNMILFISQINNTNNLNITILNGFNGKILFQNQISQVDMTQKINTLFDENFLVISYIKKNKNILRNEILTIEIMKRDIEHSIFTMLDKIFNVKSLFSSLLSNEDNNFKDLITEKVPENNINNIDNDINKDDLVFLTNTYFINRKVKDIFINKSKLNIANKYIIFLMENNSIYLVDKRQISPRRPFGKFDPKNPSAPPTIDPLMNSPYADLETIAYNPSILFDPKFIIDTNFFESSFEGLTVQPTNYESTFILCTNGLNINCYKVYPDKTFDYFVGMFPNVYILFALFGLGVNKLYNIIFKSFNLCLFFYLFSLFIFYFFLFNFFFNF